MDNTSQDNGMIRAYGLVYRLLENGVTVRWTIAPAKAQDGTDFSVAATNVETNTALGTVNYSGGPFVIDSADVAAATPFINAWLASDTVTVVHRATAAFSAEETRVLSAPPRIAVFLDGNELIAFTNLNAAGIPDSRGQAWPTATATTYPGYPDILTVADVGGVVTGGASDGALLNGDGTPKYCHLTSMHYGLAAVADRPAQTEAIREIRNWLTNRSGTHAFAECAAVETFETNVNGNFLSTAGLQDDGNAPPAPLTNRFPADPLAQYVGAITADTGLVQSIGLSAGSSLRAGTRTLINRSTSATNARMMWLAGRMDSNNANGTVTYLAGHNYSVATPVSANSLTNGVRLFFNSLFETTCGTAVAQQPNVTITKSAPAITNGTNITFTINYSNAGPGTAGSPVITDPLPAGTTFVSATNGGTVVAGVVTWVLADLASGASGSVQVTVAATADATIPNTATITFLVGNAVKAKTSNTTSTVRDATPPDTTITANPTNPSDVLSPSFSFTSPDAAATFQCSLDGAAFAACTTPLTVGPLALGSHTFQVRAVDAAGNVDPSPASYTWRVNATPVVVADTFTVAEDSSTALTVRANDTGLGDTPITTAITVAAAHGTTVINADGTIQYTPTGNYNGPDTFTYRLTDNDGQQGTAVVTINVTAVNDPPVANADALTVAEDSAATVVNVLANDTSAPDTGETLTVTAVTQPATGGTVTLIAGVVRFT
ncbi:MAG: cadherin-like domain-containing protein, partial [Deltaproteobacteria bacterium]|nr:cadherin-like domain-containing protein [Deltaproteobacteria bacterium]